MRQSVVVKQGSQGQAMPYSDKKKINNRTFSQKDANMMSSSDALNQSGIAAINQRSNRNTLFVGGAGINGGVQFAYNNNIHQSRQNTKESAESSKSREINLNQVNSFTNYHMLQNPTQ